jgi:dehydrogenase/reductase SDR family protein 4
MMPIKGKAFDGKVALITASSTGIGLAIAKRLSSEGCKVIISSRDQNHVDKAVKEIKEAGG